MPRALDGIRVIIVTRPDLRARECWPGWALTLSSWRRLARVMWQGRRTPTAVLLHV